MGLNYFGARYYDSDVAQWISVDKKRQFWSGYSYTGNGYNPINGVDPDGNQITTLQRFHQFDTRNRETHVSTPPQKKWNTVTDNKVYKQLVGKYSEPNSANNAFGKINNEMIPLIGRPEFAYGLLQTQATIYRTLFPGAGRIISLYEIVNGVHDFRNGELSSVDFTTIIGFAIVGEIGGQMISASTRTGAVDYLSQVGLNFSLSDIQNRAFEADNP